MPSSYRTTRDYAQAGIYERGSRLARSRFQGDAGPSLFSAGTYTPGAAAIKLAHAVFAFGSYKRAQQADAAAAAQAQERADLELDVLRNRADPNYMTAYQRENLDRMRAADLAPKTATPRAAMRLDAGTAKDLGLGAEGEYDPELVNTRETIRGQNMVRDRAAATAGRAGSSRRRYTAAAAALRALAAQRSRVADAAELAVREQVRGWRTEMLDKNTGKVRRAAIADSLMVPPQDRASSWGGGVRIKRISSDVDTRLIEEARLRAVRDFDEAHGRDYEMHRRVMDEESGVLDEVEGEPGLDPRTQKIIDALTPWKASSGASPR